MKLKNDNNCSWINDLNQRSNIKSLEKNQDCEWLIVGAGFTGLSAARKLGQLLPNQKNNSGRCSISRRGCKWKKFWLFGRHNSK